MKVKCVKCLYDMEFEEWSWERISKYMEDWINKNSDKMKCIHSLQVCYD